MDIKHLGYFVAVVETNFSLVDVAKKYFISQPALSQMINQFEKEHGVPLFIRSKNRLQGLTAVGEQFYEQAKQLLEQHSHMMEQLRSSADTITGKVRIGVPPFVLSTVMSSVMTHLIINNPDIRIEIVEVGAVDLRKMLILNEIDMAALLVPTTLEADSFQQELLTTNNFAAFMDYENPLAAKDQLNWSDLDKQSLVMVDKSFMSHHQLKDMFAKHQLQPKVRFTTTNWDFTLTATIGTELISLIPGMTSDYFQHPRIVKRTFADPLPWQVALCRSNKIQHKRASAYIFEQILAHFHANNSA